MRDSGADCYRLLAVSSIVHIDMEGRIVGPRLPKDWKKAWFYQFGFAREFVVQMASRFADYASQAGCWCSKAL